MFKKFLILVSIFAFSFISGCSNDKENKIYSKLKDLRNVEKTSPKDDSNSSKKAFGSDSSESNTYIASALPEEIRDYVMKNLSICSDVTNILMSSTNPQIPQKGAIPACANNTWYIINPTFRNQIKITKKDLDPNLSARLMQGDYVYFISYIVDNRTFTFALTSKFASRCKVGDLFPRCTSIRSNSGNRSSHNSVLSFV